MKIHFIQHVAFEYPGYLLHWAQQHKHEISFTKIFETVSFPTSENFDLLIIMGGPMGVYEEEKYEWMKQEKKFIKKSIEEKKKVLGICLGSQFVAEALGSKVYPHTVKEIGWWPVQKTSNHLLARNLPENFITFHWHGDTFDLPQNAIQLFSSDACAQQGFIFNNHVAGLQFHMEVMDDLLQNMTEHERDELIADKYVQTETTIHVSINEFVPSQNLYMQNFIDAFIAL